MPDHRSRARARAQETLPAELVSLVEHSHAVLVDPHAPRWRRHEAIANLAACAYCLGRAHATTEATDTMRSIGDDARELVMLPGDSGAMRRAVRS